MNKLEIKGQFWKLCEEANEFEKQNSDLPSLEPYLKAILLFVKNNHNHVDLFKNYFIELALNHNYSQWIVLYCMRELKYAEIQNAVNKQFEDLGGPVKVPRLMGFVSDINHVYEDKVWDDADFFEYHWQREHPKDGVCQHSCRLNHSSRFQ